MTLLGRNGAGKTTTLEVDHGHPRQAHAARSRSTGARRSACRRARSPGSASATARRSAASSRASSVEENLMLPPRVQPGGLSVEQIFELFPNLQGAAVEPGHQAVGRRAADAGDRPHPAHRRQAPAARRADRGAGAGDRPADRPHHRPAEDARASPSCWSSRTSASPRRSPTGTTSSSRAGSST